MRSKRLSIVTFNAQLVLSTYLLSELKCERTHLMEYYRPTARRPILFTRLSCNQCIGSKMRGESAFGASKTIYPYFGIQMAFELIGIPLQACRNFIVFTYICMRIVTIEVFPTTTITTQLIETKYRTLYRKSNKTEIGNKFIRVARKTSCYVMWRQLNSIKMVIDDRFCY